MLDLKDERLESLPIFDQLPEDMRACLQSAATTQRFARGETICLQGESAKTLKVVRSGWVKLYRMTPYGDEAVLATLHAGDSFDEIAALLEGECLASAEAVNDCVVTLINLARIGHCENAFREISRVVLAAASGQFNAMIGHIEQLKVKSGTQRLSEFLLDICQVETGGAEVDLPYEKTVLAARLGMKPESLSRSFRRLKDLGVTSKVRQVSIRDVSVLRHFAQEEAAA